MSCHNSWLTFAYLSELSSEYCLIMCEFAIVATSDFNAKLKDFNLEH